MMSNCRIFLFFICSLWLMTAYGQSLPIQKYTSKDGLISDRITVMTQDEEGFIWFGSYFGLCCYDGIKFHRIELPPLQQNKYVSSLLPLNNKVYASFLFGGGLVEYDHGRVRSYFIGNGSNEFTCMAGSADGSVFLCNSANQVYRFINGTFDFITSLPEANSSGAKYMVRDGANSIWIGTEQGLYILPYPYKTTERFFANENISSLMKDETGAIFFTHNTASETTAESCMVFKKDFEGRKTLGHLKGIREVKFQIKGTKGIWLTDYYNHLINIAGESKNIYDVSLDQSTDIKAILVDREANVWIANDPGVIKISNRGIKTYFFDQTAPAAALATFENDSVMWATNCKSLYRITDSHFEKINFPLQHPDYFGRLLFDREQNLWISLWDGGIWRTKWRGPICVEKQFYQNFGATIKVHALEEDSKGNIFMGGINGLFVFHNGKIIKRFHPLNGLGTPAFINDIALDEKNQIIWLADNAAGVIKLKYTESKNGFDFRIQQSFSIAQGLTDPYVRSLCLDKRGILWAGTRSGGIYKVLQTKNSTAITNCNREAKITCTRIAQIVSNDNEVWFATCEGAVKYDISADSWQHFATAEGVLNNEVFNIAIDGKTRTANILTSQGITRINLLQQEKKMPPLVHITGVTILGQPDSVALHTDHHRRYGYDQNSVGFEFVGLSFIDEKKVRYKYMLEGYDKHWSNDVNTNTVNYASLPPGKYTFKVMAANARGQWSASAAAFPFEVIIPFYKTSWFLFLLFMLAAVLVYFVREQRIKQRLKMERLRLNIATDLHDDIGSTLGSINLLSRSAIRKFQHASSGEDFVSVFQKIGQSAETALDAMDDIVWTINPARDKFQDLLVRMREFAIPLLEADQIQFVFHASGNEEQSISMNVRKNVFLIFKECMHNIIKHSKASKVSIDLELSAFELSVKISENGKGFNPVKQSNRNGIKNMHYRAEAVHGNLKIVSSDCGTNIFFEVPLR